MAKQKLVGPPEQIPLLRELQDGLTSLEREMERRKALDTSVNKAQNAVTKALGTIDMSQVPTGNLDQSRVTGTWDKAVNTYSAITGASLNTAGLTNSIGGLQSADVRSRVVTSGFVAVQVDSLGRLGNTASSVEYKQDFEMADTAKLVQAFFTVSLLRFRHIQAVEEQADDAPYILGSIAEYMAKTPLREYVSYTAAGDVHGINWDQMMPVAVATMQNLDSRLRSFESRLDAAGI